VGSLPGPVLNAVSPLPAGYDLLLKRVVGVLGTDSRVVAIWLSGSLAAGVADRASDLDLVVTLRGPCVQEFADSFADWRERISPTVLAEVVVPGRVFTLITPDWLRYDVVLESEADLAHPVSTPRLACWDPGDLAARLVVETDRMGPSVDAVRRLVTEWFRVTAMPECITARQDWLLATVHLSYLRDLLYRLCVQARQPMPARGVKWWSGKLSSRQRTALGRLPLTAGDRDSLITAHLAYSSAFLATAEALSSRIDLPWPTALERAARLHLATEWNIADPYPRGEPLDE
jgi:predicted nucleotidyltransferase